ncbi:MAG TPA: Mrp/NBP35 family ATP-binding protein [Bacteroidia bacterium]|nr:Mrp/NBP35 family ATP-binding protein [Bacteroidota bacterium]HRC32876.1 Mrp/NBP35 family ATP-binding protein [Bacteroidia bacterium]
MITQQQVIDALSNVEEPDLKKDLVTLNMIKDVAVDGNNVSFTVVLTTPACPLKELIRNACINAVKYYVSQEAEVTVNLTANTTRSTNADDVLLPGVKNIIAVASGKGGVGKSTVTANIAVALAQTGARVGIIDADIFGPSIPIMFGLQDERLFVEEKNGKTMMIPASRFGVKVLSIGFIADTNQAIVWRGPMASRALKQLISDAEWGELDYLFVDLPPGTSDIHLTLVSAVPLTGAVIVSTPQQVALADARKAIGMFQMESIHVPILGLVQNMAYFTPAELPENKYYIFGKDGGEKLATELGIPFLGEIPIVQSICDGGDQGIPIVMDEDSKAAIAFYTAARNTAQQIAIRNAHQPPTQRVMAAGF